MTPRYLLSAALLAFSIPLYADEKTGAPQSTDPKKDGGTQLQVAAALNDRRMLMEKLAEYGNTKDPIKAQEAVQYIRDYESRERSRGQGVRAILEQSDRKFGMNLRLTLENLVTVSVQQPKQGNNTPGINTPTAPNANTDRILEGGGKVIEGMRNTRPDEPLYYSIGGEISTHQRDFNGAFNLYGGAIERGDGSANTMAGYGNAAFHLGDTDLAAQAARLALEQDPSHQVANAVLKLSEGRIPKVNLPNAIAGSKGVGGSAGSGTSYGMAGGAGSPGTAAAPQAAGLGTLGSGQAGSANAAQVAAAIQAQINAPGSSVQKSAHLTKETATYLNMDDYSSAYAMATKAIELNDKNAQAWTYRAMANNGLQRFEPAYADATQALKLSPGNAVSLQTRSSVLSMLGRYDEALADANHTVEKNPGSGQAHFNRAFALYGRGERAESLEALRAAAEAEPRFRAKYENALQLPDDADMMLLFKPTNVVVQKIPQSSEAKKKRFLKTILTTISGGLLVALGLLHVLSAGWREKVKATMRRVIGSGSGAPAGAEAGGGPTLAPGSGFWAGYTLTREIGLGGMGVVYEAMDGSLGRRVAIKKMRDEIRVDPQERRRFITEARTVAALHHQHIVDIYSIVEDDADVYLVFEYIDGKTLSDMVKSGGPLDYEQAKRVMKGVCSAVDYAHRQNVIHRDLKPSNIMVTEEGHVKVMDFGVARTAKEALTKMSMTNTVVGTPPYMAPEQEQGTVRRESDVFALGICLYELVTGKLPFTGQGAGMLLNKINGKHIPPSQARPGLPAELDAIMAKALCPDPDKRYRTAAELWQALEGQSAVRA